MPRGVKGGVKETNADGVIYTDSAYSNSAEKRAHYVNHHMKGKQPSQLADDRETAEGLGLIEPGWFVHAWSDTRGTISYAILGPDNAVYTNKSKAISAHKRAAEIYLQCQRKVSGNRICGAIKKAYDNSMPSCDTCGGGPTGTGNDQKSMEDSFQGINSRYKFSHCKCTSFVFY